MSEPYDWTYFKMRIPIKASASAILDSWQTKQGIESWFLRSSKYQSPEGVSRKDTEPAQPGDGYTWLWHGHSDEVIEHGNILEHPDGGFSFTFAGSCRVDISIKDENVGCMMNLIQSAIPVTDEAKRNIHLGCSMGWTFYLTNLKSVLEGGLDLRNRDISLNHVVNS